MSCLLLTLQSNAQQASSDDLLKQALHETNVTHQYQKAIEDCKRGLEQSPDYLDIRLLLGRLYFLTNQYNDARIELNKVLQKDPKNKNALNYLINLESSAKNYEEALCYVNTALFYYPESQDLDLKKSSILTDAANYPAANKWLEQLLEAHPDNNKIRQAYIDERLLAAKKYMEKNEYDYARQEVLGLLEKDPSNKIALNYLINLEADFQNYDGAVLRVNQALHFYPDDENFLLKKLSVLEEARRYPEAEAMLKSLLKEHPGDKKYQQLYIDLHLSAGRALMMNDPQYQFDAVLQKDPSNQQALNYLINLNSAQHNNEEALRYVNEALHYYPNDENFLLKKISLLEALQKFREAYPITKKLLALHPANTALRENYLAERIATGKAFLRDQETDSARAEFDAVLDIDPRNTAALDNLIAIESDAKNYALSLAYLDRALQYYPGSEKYLLRKSGVMEAAGRFPEAYYITAALMKMHPNNIRYQQSNIDQHLEAGRYFMNAQQPDSAGEEFLAVLQNDPGNEEALNYLINAQSGMQQYNNALRWSDTALAYYPSSVNFKIKKASILESAHRYQEACNITGPLVDQNPYNKKLLQIYIDESLASGRNFLQRNLRDSARYEFIAVLNKMPEDTDALNYLVNLESADSNYPAAIAYADSALKYHPASATFMLKKASLLSANGQYSDAAIFTDSLLKLYPSNIKAKALAFDLKTRNLSHQIGINYTYTFFGNKDKNPWNLASVFYQKNTQWGSYDGRLDFADRNNNAGLQLEAESYINHSPKYYSYIGLAFAHSVIFPKFRAAYSLTHNFQKGWEGELGFRYLDLDSSHDLSFTAAAGKYFSDYWANLRVFISPQNQKIYQAYRLTLRYYYDDIKDDYVTAIIGSGTSPDDRSRYFQFARRFSLSSANVALGYQKLIKSKNIIGILASWTNQEVEKGVRQNEYDIYFNFIQKF